MTQNSVQKNREKNKRAVKKYESKMRDFSISWKNQMMLVKKAKYKDVQDEKIS